MLRCSYCHTYVYESESDSPCPNCGHRLDAVSDSPATVITQDTATSGAMPEQKRRHGCLTAYLVVVIVGNSAVTLAYLLGGAEAYPWIPWWALALIVFASIFIVVSAIALLKWKKWGFWVFLGSIVGIFWVNLLIGVGPLSFLGLLAVPVLYGVLHIGEKNKGWPQLD